MRVNDRGPFYPGRVIDLSYAAAHRLGIASKLETNASIALGTSEVSLTELVGAYAPFANGGRGVTPHVVTKIRTPEGKVLYARLPDQLGQVIEPRSVAMMNHASHTLSPFPSIPTRFIPSFQSPLPMSGRPCAPTVRPLSIAFTQ